MPKRKAKRPVGRPKEHKIKPSAEGKVFPVDYGVYRPQAIAAMTEAEWIKYTDTEVPVRLAQSVATTEATIQAIESRLASYDNMSPTMRRELRECLDMLAFLRSYAESIARWQQVEDQQEKNLLNPSGDKLTISRLMAIAYTAGQLSVTVPHREHEATYATGKKMVASARQGAKRRKIDRPSKSELSADLSREIAKHGKRTLAITATAKHYGVSKNTLRSWIKELAITMK